MKMTKDIIPDDFTLTLALVDGLPVLFFAGSMILISLMFRNKLFLFGALLCLFAGLSKVFWKIIVVLRRKNIWFLFLQMRITMPIGMIMILSSLFIEKIEIKILLSYLLSFPSNVFFTIGMLLMLAMLVFAFTLDNSKKSNNWIEQITNIIAQLSFFIGILLIVL